MVRYYVRLVYQAPSALWNAANGTLVALGVALIVLALGNREVARAASSWDGVSPIWAAAVFVALFVLGMAQANYAVVRDAEASAAKQIETERRHQQAEELAEQYKRRATDAEKRYAVSEAQFKALRDLPTQP